MNLRNAVSSPHLCGHAGSLSGSGRYGRIQEADRSYVRNNLCMACIREIQALIDTARTDTAKLAAESGLLKPVARGSMKQEAWAKSIIAEVFPLLAAVAAAGRARGDAIGIATARAIALICQIEDAGFWIKYQQTYRIPNAYCIAGDVADITRQATHSLQGRGTSWLAGLLPGTATQDKHYRFAQKDRLSRLVSDPTSLDAVANG